MAQWLRQVEQLRGWRQTAFLTALAERGYPNFALFAEVSDGLDGKPLRQALDRLWAALLEEEDKTDYPRLVERVEAEWPDPEQFEGYGVHPAEDVASITLDALLSRILPDKKRALEGAQRSLQTVTQFVELNDAEGIDEDDMVNHLDRHPLVRQELHFQRELVERLRRTGYPSAGFLQELRDFASNDGVSNLGIGLQDEDA